MLEGAEGALAKARLVELELLPTPMYDGQMLLREALDRMTSAGLVLSLTENLMPEPGSGRRCNSMAYSSAFMVDAASRDAQLASFPMLASATPAHSVVRWLARATLHVLDLVVPMDDTWVITTIPAFDDTATAIWDALDEDRRKKVVWLTHADRPPRHHSADASTERAPPPAFGDS